MTKGTEYDYRNRNDPNSLVISNRTACSKEGSMTKTYN